MEPETLQRHVRTLATLPETDAPVISCYLELNKGRVEDCNTFDELSGLLQRGLLGASRQHVADAYSQSRSIWPTSCCPTRRGSRFSRAGAVSLSFFRFNSTFRCRTGWPLIVRPTSTTWWN